jgi:hypothetical protein
MRSFLIHGDYDDVSNYRALSPFEIRTSTTHINKLSSYDLSENVLHSTSRPRLTEDNNNDNESVFGNDNNNDGQSPLPQRVQRFKGVFHYPPEYEEIEHKEERVIISNPDDKLAENARTMYRPKSGLLKGTLIKYDSNLEEFKRIIFSHLDMNEFNEQGQKYMRAIPVENLRPKSTEVLFLVL